MQQTTSVRLSQGLYLDRFTPMEWDMLASCDPKPLALEDHQFVELNHRLFENKIWTDAHSVAIKIAGPPVSYSFAGGTQVTQPHLVTDMGPHIYYFW